jgi:hypothetical protein
MSKLVDNHKTDRKEVRDMILKTFERDQVPQDLVNKYLAAYDAQTDIGEQVARWLDENRPVQKDA